MAASFDQVREIFANQFEADDDGYLYRQNSKAAPIRVSARERDGFVADFNRDLRIGIWGMFAAMGAILALMLFILPLDVDSDASMVPIGAGFVMIFIVAIVSQGWAFRAPARTLTGRAAVGAARTKDEMQRRMLQKMDYRNIAGTTAALVAVAALRYHWGQPPFSGVNLFILCIIPLLLGGGAFTAWRKYRSEHVKHMDRGDRPRWS